MVDWPPKGCGRNETHVWVIGPAPIKSAFRLYQANEVGVLSEDMRLRIISGDNCGGSTAPDKSWIWLCEDCARRGGYIW